MNIYRLFFLCLLIIPTGAEAQYDARKLTHLYQMTLQSRILSERLLADVVLSEQGIKSNVSRKKLLNDLHQFQDLTNKIIANVPENANKLQRLFRAWKTKTNHWVSTINGFLEHGNNTQDIFRLVNAVNASYESLKAHLELLLGFSEEQLDRFSRLVEIYIITERSFAAYVLQHSETKTGYGKNYYESAKWNTAINALLKLRKQVGKKGDIRRQMNLLLSDLVFFKQADERAYDPLMIFTPFIKFDAKYDRLFEMIFKSSPWI